MKEIAVVVPVHNEEAAIDELVDRLRRVCLDELQLGETEFELLLVDDGSTDASQGIIQRLERQGLIRSVRHERNRGYGAALLSGFHASQARFVALIDGDLQLFPEDLPKLYAHRRVDRVVLGFRSPRRDPWGRVLLGAFFSRFCVPLFLGVSVRDVDCALKIFPRVLLESNRYRSEGALISAEILCSASQQGYRFVEVPVRHAARTAGTASGASLRVLLRALLELYRLRSRSSFLSAVPRGALSESQ